MIISAFYEKNFALETGTSKAIAEEMMNAD
jgi:hypothetical protein